ncbi:hypothetical protein ADIS_0247 [Lunatimonas lonarensis]|uniref:Uncharacterized protein n=1 Tax=Lunatimonas lonarensis TaxID=1232681 RepID=R7ZYR8_9BACT|nr:hypothetical protein [Lunatimonas lonarensis]EON79242.1 hypothetical protein ADIS_0247 [Lunatimonas lonarensis]
MIVSANPDPSRSEFDLLLRSTVLELNIHAKNASKEVSTLLGRKLEPYVKDLMSEKAKGTPFEGSIELIGGQKFPDIIAKKYYGIEVKTTTQNHWKTTGNSVLEGTRVENIERIFMLFAKLSNPIEFRCRPYEDVLSEVVVTHSPRYLIDMNLEEGNTIFDKIEVAYDTLRKKENPIKPIVEYYKSKLKPGEELWWMDADDNSKPSNLIIRIWNNLSIKERYELKNRAMVFFPELFGNGSDKFGRFAIWLVTREAVVCPNIRDLFTAGGRSDCIIGGVTYRKVPRIFLNLFTSVPAIIEVIKQTSAFELSEYWETRTTNKTKILDWINLVVENSKKVQDARHLNIREILTEIAY